MFISFSNNRILIKRVLLECLFKIFCLTLFMSNYNTIFVFVFEQGPKRPFLFHFSLPAFISISSISTLWMLFQGFSSFFYILGENGDFYL